VCVQGEAKFVPTCTHQCPSQCGRVVSEVGWEFPFPMTCMMIFSRNSTDTYSTGTCTIGITTIQSTWYCDKSQYKGVV